MATFSETKLEDGRARLVRHGHLPEREVMTGIGPVPVKVLRLKFQMQHPSPTGIGCCYEQTKQAPQ
jgi:hypothetical protein